MSPYLLFALVLSSAQPVAAEPRQPIYTAWLAGPGTNPCARSRADAAFTIAVHVGKGYLVAPITAFERVVEDLSLDSRVCVQDGGTIVEGRLVDSDSPLRLVLIKADVKGPAIVPSENGTDLHVLIGYDPRGTSMPLPIIRLNLRSCEEGLSDGVRKYRLACAIAPDATSFTSGIALDPHGKFVAFLVAPYNVVNSIGPNAAAIRSFVDTYFKSWGRWLPKSVRPW